MDALALAFWIGVPVAMTISIVVVVARGERRTYAEVDRLARAHRREGLSGFFDPGFRVIEPHRHYDWESEIDASAPVTIATPVPPEGASHARPTQDQSRSEGP